MTPSAMPEHVMSAGDPSVAVALLSAAWDTTLELAPWLLVGCAVAGILHGLLPKDFVRRHLQGGGGVFKAVTLGVPLPLCSCGVIPAGLGLRKDGASRGAAIGFLTSTPQTGVDSILVSASFLGWPFAMFKVVAALVSGLVGGWLVDAVEPEEAHGHESKGIGQTSTPHHLPWGPRIAAMIEHAVEILQSIWRWLVFGVALSAVITVLVPDAWLQGLGGLGALGAGLAALAISLPLYVCATASVPIAAALVAGGMPAGAALVFLMAGPATNVATIGAVLSGFGRRALAIYLGTLIVFSLGAGIVFERVVPTSLADVAHHDHAAGLVPMLSAGLMLALFAWFAMQESRTFLRGRGAQPTTPDAPAVAMTIEGMTCGGCANKVRTRLMALPGAQDVQVEIDPGRATIHGRVQAADAVAAVEAAGYEAAVVG